MRIVESSGTSFAFPSQTIYMARDREGDVKVKQSVQSDIQQLINDSALPIPDYTQTQISNFSNSMQYPPKGSVLSPSDKTI